MPRYRNWWRNPDTQDWFTHFFQFVLSPFEDHTRNSVMNKLDFVSVFGPIQLLNQIPSSQIKILFIGENVSRKGYAQYNNNHHNSQISDLVLGFRDIPSKKMNTIRFPLWLMYIPFYRNLQLTEEHTEKCKNAYLRQIKAIAVCSHDRTGIRGRCADECLKKRINVDIAGNWRHRMCNDVHIGKRNTDKIKLMENYLINVCPENSLDDGYTTEKLFQSIEAGCIPLYNGCKPAEINVLNQSRIVYIDDFPKLDLQSLSKISNIEPYTPNSSFWIMKYYLEMWSKVWYIAHTKGVNFKFNPTVKSGHVDAVHNYFILPYRNRKAHFETWTKAANQLYAKNKQFKFDVILVEQFDDKPFNKGRLLNVGFWKVMELHHSKYGTQGLLHPRPNLIFNDVDVFCKDMSFFRPEEYVYHPYGDPHCLGCMFVCSPEAYLSFNGFSNKYNGWGREDVDALYRCTDVVKIPVKKERYERRRANKSFAEFPHKSNITKIVENYAELDDLKKNHHNLHLSGVKTDNLAEVMLKSKTDVKELNGISYVHILV